MLVVKHHGRSLHYVEYVWEPGVSAEEDAKMNRIMEQVKECSCTRKWMVEDDYEKGLYHIYDDTEHNRIGPPNQLPFTKFAGGEYEPEPEEDKWWEKKSEPEVEE